MEHLKCTIERVTFANEDSGFSVVKAHTRDDPDLVTVVGAFAGVNAGSNVDFYGEWVVDSRYGRQFSASEFHETIPASVAGIEKYLGSGMIKGVGAVMARRIVRRFREKTFEVIDNSPERLIEVEGIGEKRVEMIINAWREHREIKNVMMFLQEHGVSTAYAIKIFRVYGEKSIAKVRENPFRLADDIWGIGFVTADKIAQKMGFPHDSPQRCAAGVVYALNRNSDDGHCYALSGDLLDKSRELLEVAPELCAASLEGLVREGKVIREDADKLFLPPFWHSEVGVARKIVKIAGGGAEGGGTERGAVGGAEGGVEGGVEGGGGAARDTSAKSGAEGGGVERGAAGDAEGGVEGGGKADDYGGGEADDILLRRIDDGIRWTEAASGVHYDDIQKDAVRTALTSSFMVLTGGPGTGKTTTTHAIINVCERLGARVLLAAPTGRAAKRLSEATGREAKTIHRLLEFSPPDGYKRDGENPLNCDFLIIDEASMLDVILTNNLLKAVPDGASVIFVGDVDQLPSVGPGSVLRDIIDSGTVKTVALTRIFRQAQSSDIIKNAHRVNEGRYPYISNSRKTDFFFTEKDDPEEAAKTIIDLCKERLPKFYGIDAVEDIQVLCPMTKGVIGTANLNVELQSALNPNTQSIKFGSTVYKLGDKVMQIRNNYDKNVFNGDIGKISAINNEERSVSIRVDGVDIEYDVSELDEVVLAYAVTVHKSQGSEYPVVVCPVSTQHYMMLQRNLIYTAITRAKKTLVLVGSKKALSIAVSTKKSSERNTTLAQRLREAYGGKAPG